MRENGEGNERMPVFVRHNGKFYKISDEILAKSGIPKSQFDHRLQELENSAAEKAKPLRHARLIEFADDEFDDIGSK